MSDRGAVTPYALVFVVTMMMIAGLVVDGSTKLRAGWEAQGIAEEAARAAAGEIDRSAVYVGHAPSVDRGAAVRAAQAYLSTSGHPGSVGIAGPESIRVTVPMSKPTWLLGILGIHSISVTGEAVANLVTGVEGPGR